MASNLVIENKEIAIHGRWFKRAQLRAEYYDPIPQPASIIESLARSGTSVDLFTFVQSVNELKPLHPYYWEPDPIAVLKITTYEAWWKSLKDKTRNMVRKATKSGVEIRSMAFDDVLVGQIKELYDECPIRQGKPFKHYGKSLEVLKRDHATFLDRSEFIGAFYQEKLIGFIKMVHGENVSNLMQILSMISHRDKAPTNALIAKAVEICAQKQLQHLHYGVWSRRGIGEFKIHHRFEQIDVPRYYVPLSWKGSLLLKGRLHHQPIDYIPEPVMDKIAGWRAKWYANKYKHQMATSR